MLEGQIFVCAVHENQNKVLKIAHLNAELLKCRQHFFQTKELALEIILTSYPSQKPGSTLM